MCFLNQVPVAIYGFDPDTKERVRLHLDFLAFIISPISTRHLQVPYTDCADVPLEVTLTNSKDFSYVTKSGGQMTKKMLQFLSSPKRQKTAKDFFSTVFSFCFKPEVIATTVEAVSLSNCVGTTQELQQKWAGQILFGILQTFFLLKGDSELYN